MPLAEANLFRGCNIAQDPRFLPDGVGVIASEQKPTRLTGRPELEGWGNTLDISASTNLVDNPQTIYRLGRNIVSNSTYWLAFTTHVHLMRDFAAADTSERTAFSGSGSPKWTNNVIGISGEPYPTATRELAVPKPTVKPTVTLDTDGPSGTARQNYYAYTWVSDIGWESAPSPPELAPLAKPGAILDLAVGGAPPAGNYGITIVRWYRTEVSTTGESEFFFLREYAIGTSGQEDDARALNTALPMTTAEFGGWLPPDTNATFLTACWNDFAAIIVGRSVRFCRPGYLYAWPPQDHTALFASQPLALAAFSQRLLVLTDGVSQIGTGDDPTRMDFKPIDLPVITSVRGLVVTKSYCMYPARDGLVYVGTDGVRMLTLGMITADQWLSFSPSTMFAAQLNGMWFGAYNDGGGFNKVLVIDPQNSDGFYTAAPGAALKAFFWDDLLRKLFFADGTDNLFMWDYGDGRRTCTFRTKAFRQLAETEPEWVELLATEATAIVRLRVDGTERDEFDAVASGEYRVANGVEGREFQLEVVTDGRVQAVVAE